MMERLKYMNACRDAFQKCFVFWCWKKEKENIFSKRCAKIRQENDVTASIYKKETKK